MKKFDDIVHVIKDDRSFLVGKKFHVIYHHGLLGEIVNDDNKELNGYVLYIPDCKIITQIELRKQKLNKILNESW